MLIEELKEALNNHTYDEIKEKFNLSSRALNKLIKENNLKIKYTRRTRYTNILVPVDSPFNKYTGKKLEEANKFQAKYSSNNWYKNQLKIYKSNKEEAEFRLGTCLYKQHTLNEEMNKLKQRIDYYNHSFKVLKEAQKTDDYYGFREEEDLYTSEIKPIDEYLSDNMIIGYLTEKYGINKAIAVSNILKE